MTEQQKQKSEQKKNQALQLIDQLKNTTQDDAEIAIGLDVAASEDNWGLCVIRKTKEEVSSIELLLPQAAQKKNGDPHKTELCRPSLEILKALLLWIKETKLSASIAVDVPFGWPVEHSAFVQHWKADIERGVDLYLPSREEFEQRLCDRMFGSRFKDERISPLSVSADTLGQAAFTWAKSRVELQDLIGTIDFGLECGNRSQVSCFETYPAAFVRLCFPDQAEYKSDKKKEIRGTLWEKIKNKYKLEPLGTEKTKWLKWACNQAGSPDAFDALLCAVCALEHLRDRPDNNGSVFTTPGALLRRDPTHEETSTIKSEGWILVPVPRDRVTQPAS